MALSDACFEFLQANAKAAEELATAVHHYATPGYPITYGIEIDALRQACLTVRERPYDAEAGAELLRLAASVMTFHDAAPFEPERIRREAEMNKLIRKLLEEPLQADDKAAVPATIQNIGLRNGGQDHQRYRVCHSKENVRALSGLDVQSLQHHHK